MDNVKGNIICSILQTDNADNIYSGKKGIGLYATTVWIPNDSVSLLIGNTIVYELATPVWEDITETETGRKLLEAKTIPNTEMRISVNKGAVEVEWYEAK